MSGWRRGKLDPIPAVPGSSTGHGDCDGTWRTSGLEFACTRPAGHPGRHLAGIGADHVVAAWPGEGRPTVADLTEVPS